MSHWLQGFILLLVLIPLYSAWYTKYMRTANLASFNTGLTLSIPSYKQRKAAMIDEIRNSKADLICLQEVWLGQDVVEFQQALQAEFPYSFSTLHNNNGIIEPQQPACEATVLQTLLACVSPTCDLTKPAQELLACAIASGCGLLEDLTQDCLTCVITVSDPTQYVSKCVLPGSMFNRPGLLLLSKRQLLNRAAIDLLPGYKRLFPRWLLYSNVEEIGKVGCTHLMSDFGPYVDPVNPPLFSSFEEENLNNTREVLKIFREEDTFALMGDFNTSPTIGNRISAVFPASYAEFLNSGLSAPYDDLVGKTTYGVETNPLSVGTPNDQILDHIFLKGITALKAERIFDRFVDGLRGLPLSDHFGVQVTVSTRRRKKHGH